MSAYTKGSLIFRPPAFSSASPGGYGLRVLSRLEDRSALIAVRRAAFERAGRLAEHAPLSAAEDPFDDAAPTLHLSAFKGAQTLGAMRVTFKGWTDPITVLPCAAHFAAIRSAGLRKLAIAEFSHLVTDPYLSEQTGAVVHAALLRASLLAAQAARSAMIVTATASDRAAFYGKLLRFHPIGTPACYPPGHDSFTLTGGSMVGAAGRGIARHAFFITAEDEIASMRVQLLRCLEMESDTGAPASAPERSRLHQEQ